MRFLGKNKGFSASRCVWCDSIDRFFGRLELLLRGSLPQTFLWPVRAGLAEPLGASWRVFGSPRSFLALFGASWDSSFGGWVFLGKNMVFSASVAFGVAKYGKFDRVHVAFGCFYR